MLVLVDSRIGLKPSDVQMVSPAQGPFALTLPAFDRPARVLSQLEFLEVARVKYTLVLTKADLAGPPRRIAQAASLRRRHSSAISLFAN